jgi:hypothetical protein
MRLISLPLFALSLSLSLIACGGDDGGGSGDDDPGSPDAGVTQPGTTCGPLRGSCRQNDGAGCADFYSPVGDPTDYRAECETDGDATWSSQACDAASSVGGCRVGAVAQICATAWAYPPVTAAQVMQACAPPNTYVPAR